MDQEKFLQNVSSTLQQITRQKGQTPTTTGIPYLIKMKEVVTDGSGQFAVVKIGGKDTKVQLAPADYCILFQDATSPVPMLFIGGGSSGMWRD